MRTRTLTKLAAVLAVAVIAAGCKTTVVVTSTAPPSATGAPDTAAPPTATDTGGATYSGNGVTFQYPADWQTVDISGASASSGTTDWQTAVGPTDVSFVIVSQYTQTTAIDDSNISQAESSITSDITNLFTQAGGELSSGPTQLTVGGFPTLQYEGTVKTPNGDEAVNRLSLVFNGTTQYTINCQYTTADSSTLLPGCDQVESTFATTA